MRKLVYEFIYFVCASLLAVFVFNKLYMRGKCYVYLSVINYLCAVLKITVCLPGLIKYFLFNNKTFSIIV